MTDRLTIEQFKALVLKKPAKYRNEKTPADGIQFDSKREAKRYQSLQLMLRAGLIADLRRQVVYLLMVNGKLICRYKADFVYLDLKTGKQVVEDAKGFRTKEYRLKAKLFEAIYGFEILEI
jgi:hypothetical protein